MNKISLTSPGNGGASSANTYICPENNPPSPENSQQSTSNSSFTSGGIPTTTDNAISKVESPFIICPPRIRPGSFAAFEIILEDHFMTVMANRGGLEKYRTVMITTNRNFSDLRHLYTGPNVKIILGDGEDRLEWDLPKKLLSFHSDYFKDALLPTINDDDNHTLYFERQIADAFDVMVRLMFTGSIHFDKGPTPSGQITRYLDFFHLGERLDIGWARTKIDSIAVHVEGILAKEKEALISSHIHSAFELASDHPMQIFIAEMCYKHYLMTDYFKFWREWLEIPDFSKVLLRASKNVAVAGGLSEKAFQKMDWESSDEEDVKSDGDTEGTKGEDDVKIKKEVVVDDIRRW